MTKLILLTPLLFLTAFQQKDTVVEKGIKYLLDTQQTNGSWQGLGNPVQHPQAELPATALCAMALMSHPDIEPARSKEAVKKARQFVETFQQGEKWTVWGEPYSVLFLSRMHKDTKDASLKKTIEKMVKVIEANHMNASGGWGYWGAPGGSQDHAKTFNTALCLQALGAAREAGIKIDEARFKRGVEAMKKLKDKNGLYNYHFWSGDQKNATQARFQYDQAEPLTRSVMAETVMLDAKQGSQDALNGLVVKFFDQRANLERAYQSRDVREAHLKPNGTAAYYYFFGHYYAAAALKRCPEATQKKYKPVLREVMAKTQEANGSWYDHKHLGGLNVSTAYALLSLAAVKE